jgi:hypothetical protein
VTNQTQFCQCDATWKFQREVPPIDIARPVQDVAFTLCHSAGDSRALALGLQDQSTLLAVPVMGGNDNSLVELHGFSLVFRCIPRFQPDLDPIAVLQNYILLHLPKKFVVQDY